MTAGIKGTEGTGGGGRKISVQEGSISIFSFKTAVSIW
jgi:hypothetical protein